MSGCYLSHSSASSIFERLLMLKIQKELKGETDHCRSRLMKYCNGQGVDLGCGQVKLRPSAIGIDLGNPAAADMRADARVLKMYSNDFFDYVFSSHLLEQLENTEAVLREWVRIVKPGGYLVLYQADKEYYYPIGHPQCNALHKHHFSWEDLWAILEKIGGVYLVHHARFDTHVSEWSFELVVRKGQPLESVDCSEGISFLIPTLNRPQAIEEFSARVDGTTTHPENVEILFGVHADDKASIEKVQEIKSKFKISIRSEIIERHKDGVHLAFLWNQLYPRAKYPIVGYFGDDVIFHTTGWDEEVRKEFLADKSVLVSCNDVHIHRGQKATLFFTHKLVHDKLGFYLHPQFRRWYTDTFWELVYRNAGKLRYREDIVTEHLSPDVFKERTDSTYSAMQSLKGTDGPIWNSQEVREQIRKFSEILKEMK